MIDDDPNGIVPTGMTGIVCHYTSAWEDIDGCNIGVEWDNDSPSGYHNCMGTCKLGHGRYVPHTCLALSNYDLGEIESSEISINALFDTSS